MQVPWFFLLRKFIPNLLWIFMLLPGCQERQVRPPVEITPAFYHWKTTFKLGDPEKDLLQQWNVKKLYVKYFDVDWDEESQQPLPVAMLRVQDHAFFKQVEIVPTVFITNLCIARINSSQCLMLAMQILQLIQKLDAQQEGRSVKEIQIDCDWTELTRARYFSILEELQKLDTIHTFSVTLRLHQVKYASVTGIPPVKRAMLMCYNMGNLKNIETRNSIIDPAEFSKYIGRLEAYPLSLDVALPLFSWHVLSRRGKYAGLLREFDSGKLGLAAQKKDNRFTLLKDTSLAQFDFLKGDELRFEESSYADIMKVTQLLQPRLGGNARTVALYHLDPLILNKYPSNEIENIFRSLR